MCFCGTFPRVSPGRSPDHLALWCPDFPRRVVSPAAAAWPAQARVASAESPREQLRGDVVVEATWDPSSAADVDLATWKTWDKYLVREKRILVPVDVQAYVVPTGGQEQCVDVAGVDGDPAPFDPGAVRAAGVHLHWALPDALLRGENDPVTKKVKLPRLPDRWVVVRTLLPEGARAAYAVQMVLSCKKEPHECAAQRGSLPRRPAVYPDAPLWLIPLVFPF